MGLNARDSFARVVVAVGLGCAVSLTAVSQPNPRVPAVVTSVIDGDTIKVQLESGPMLVRLANIDAPELGQAGGGAAARALHGKVLGSDVMLDVVTRDGLEQFVAVVWLGEENVNAWLVKQGHAWAYRPFTQDANYCVWEDAARRLHRGLWAAQDWMPPWEWRQSKRDASFFASDYSHINAAGCIREMGKAQAFDD